jgi:urease accessory protein
VTNSPASMDTATAPVAAPDLVLMTWLSPSFPVGAFAYSHGLEWAQEAGDLPNAAALEAWLLAVLEHGAARNDAIVFACTYRAVTTGDDAALHEAAELALALANSAERRLETVTQGNAFLLAASTSWPCTAYERLAKVWSGDVAYPVAVATAAAGHGIPIAKALPAFVLGFIANLVSASVRLGIIGQTDGQRITAGLTSRAAGLGAEAVDLTLADLGGCAFRSDLAALRHETQYSRLFRS